MAALRVALAARRLPSSRAASSLAYTFKSHGDIGAVLAPQNLKVADAPSGTNVLVNWLAAGVDDVDIAAVQGLKSAAEFVPPALPAIAGTEGVALVKAVGPDVKAVKSGDFVIPIKTAVGTWCETALLNESQVVQVPKTVRMELAATLSASPFTALRLLSDFGSLKPGDVVVQSAGASAVGTALVQIANEMGLRTVSLVRENSADYAAAVERLKLMGGDVVIGESYVKSSALASVMSDLPPPKLGINGSDSDSCALVASLVGSGATVVTYCPGTSNATALKSKSLKSARFSLAEWLDSHQGADAEAMVSRLTGLIEHQKLTGWLQRVKFADLPNAIQVGSSTRRKLVAIMPDGEAYSQ